MLKSSKATSQKVIRLGISIEVKFVPRQTTKDNAIVFARPKIRQSVSARRTTPMLGAIIALLDIFDRNAILRYSDLWNTGPFSDL